MNSIKVQHFGPIKKGYLENGGWLAVNKVAVFIGNQGSGKSTMAKLIASLVWIEKSMVRGILRQDELNTPRRFAKISA